MRGGPAALAPSFPLSQFVLKVHSRCDLACDHCYIYEHADQSWRNRPHAMAAETVRVAAARIAEHAAAHELVGVRVVLHGGEPLLLGYDALRAAITTLRAAIEPITHLDLRMQSNGVRLTPRLCALFVEHGVRVGISFDGDPEAHDRHRRFATGAGSYQQAVRALALLRQPEFRPSYAGILCTIDIRNDPIRVYEALLAQEPPRVDLLLPHATWDRPPDRPGPDPTPYATWLGRVYERWLADDRPMPIRMFDSLLAAAAGKPSGTESVGVEPIDLVVIETDGAWEQADSIKTAYDGAPATGLTIFSHPAAAVAELPVITARQRGLAGLCDACRGCAVARQCGGGLYAHRFRTGTGFANPSVYCADLFEIVTMINRNPPPPRAHPPPPAPASTARAVEPLIAGTAPVARPAGRATGETPLGQDRSDPDPPQGDRPDGLLLDALRDAAGGYATAATMGVLADAGLAIVRALVGAIAGGDLGGEAVAAGWELLTRLDREAPTATRAVLGHPYVRGWAVGTLRAAGGADRPPGGDPDYLACVAAAVAIRAGVPAQLTLTVPGPVLHLPSVGTITPPEPVARAELTVAPSGFRVRFGSSSIHGQPDRPAPGFRPTPRVELPSVDLPGMKLPGFMVALEDADPYRECYPWPAAPARPATQLHQWRARLRAAWRLIARDVPEHLQGLALGLRAITPLRPGGAGLRGATARDAFGAVGLDLAPADAVAVMLVHEFQHAKLGLLMDVCDLVEPRYRGLLAVGWRPDRRPVDAVLQGTYAHLAVADVWRARARAGVPGAAELFARYRGWTVDALGALAATGALTPAGAEFVARMAGTVHGWSG